MVDGVAMDRRPAVVKIRNGTCTAVPYRDSFSLSEKLG